jgi:hypothetical protein
MLGRPAKPGQYLLSTDKHPGGARVESLSVTRIE